MNQSNSSSMGSDRSPNAAAVDGQASADANVLRAVRVTTAPAFDFAAHPWTECPTHMPFVFQQSDLAVSEQTRLRLLYDERRLYIGIACELSQPASPAGPLGYLGEHIEVFLAPANKQESSLQFAVNVSGGASALDHHQPESSTTRRPWWAGWSAQTRSSDKSWETLITIPLPRPMREGEIWGLNVYRCHETPAGVSSWCPYSTGFDIPAEFGNLVFGNAAVSLPAHRLPVQWPTRVPDKPLEYHLTIDPPDDFLGSYIDPERLDGYFRFFAELGIKRAYWMDRGPYSPAFMRIFGASWGQDIADRFARSMATFGNDPFPAAIAAAHKHGMEIYSEVKPWDWGNCELYPPNRWLEGLKGLERVGGLAYMGYVQTFLEHPEWNMMRSPVGCADNGHAIAEIVMMKDDKAPVPFPVEKITVWASNDNMDYQPVPGAVITESVENAPVLRRTFSVAEETGEHRPVRVIRVRGINIPQRYIALEIPGRENKFENRAFALARLFDEQGREIPASIGYLSVNGSWWGGKEGWRENGIYFEMSGAASEAGGFLIPWALDNACGVIGLARGRNRVIPGALEPADPGAAEWLLNWPRRAVALGADGFEYRVRNHQVAMEWEAYGYSPAVQAAFRKARGRELRLDGSDTAVLREFRGVCYTEILRKAKAICAGAGIPFGLQITSDLYHDNTDACTMGLNFEWRRWIREGIADQMLAFCISPFSPVFRDLRQESKRAGIPFYAVFGRLFDHPDFERITRSYFDAARRTGVDAVNIYEAANVARINDAGETVSIAPRFTEFLRNYSRSKST